MASSEGGTPREIFEAVVALPAPLRSAELHRLCAGNEALRLKVERLLAADARAQTFLETMPSVNEDEDTPSGLGVARVGQMIGRYRVRRLIGSGGMGAVYEAEQDRPHRLVALKVIRPGLVRHDLLRRFEYEAEALARLRHPGIAQIYESGSHLDPGTGLEWPYIAMELVANAQPLTTHAATLGLTEAARLRLFAQVCDAVHHAHQRGVIHRDLKPANILVDDAGRVRVIDFGVARAADPDVSLTAGTGAGQLVGTLQYMSPEQCSAQSADIDTRSDVYALGVVLYELVSGKLPYDVKSVPPIEAARVVREAPPARLRPAGIADDLEAIIFKALEKDRERRYGSAAELGEDIERYLSGSGVRARPPTLMYQIRTFARRHRAIAISGAITAAALLLGVTGTTLGLLRALDERDRSLALQASTEEEATRAKRMAAFLRDVLASVNPYDFKELAYYTHPESTIGKRIAADPVASGVSLPPSDILLRAAGELTARFPDDPLIRGELGTILGEALTLSGWLVEARELLSGSYRTLLRELGRRNLVTVRAAEWLAHAMEQFEPGPEIIALREYAVEMRTQLQGELHPQTLRSSLALVRAIQRGGNPADAVAIQRKRWMQVKEAMGEESAAAVEQQIGLALALSAMEDHEAATRMALDALAACERLWGEWAPITAHARRLYSGIAWAAGHHDKAEQAMRAALASTAGIVGADSPAQATLEMDLLYLVVDRRDFRGALPLARRQVAASISLHGVTHHVTYKMKHMVAVCLLETGGDLDEAEALARDALDGVISMREYARISRYRTTLARIVRAQGRPVEAEQLLRITAAEEGTWRDYDRPPQNALIYLALTHCLVDQGRLEEATEALERAKSEAPRVSPKYPRISAPYPEDVARAQAALDAALAARRDGAAIGR